jgi:hypothetical protein
MGTFNAFYVKAKADEHTATAAIRARFPRAEMDSSPEFVGIAMPDDAFEAPERDLKELSFELKTDVIWLSLQSAVDAFQFHHWRAGKQLRSLVFGCFVEERTWERVEGEAEPWERDVFFDPRALEIPLEFATTEDEKDELRRIWQSAELLPGRTEPSLASKECAHKIARFFHFPHYGL